MRYAQNTTVPVDRSRAEIERTLLRFGASKFQYGWDGDHAVITFALHDRVIRFTLPLPDRNDPKFTKTAGGRRDRSTAAAAAAWEAAQRQKFRALALSIKSKLVAVDEQISEFEDEFLAHIVVPGGHTVGQMVRPQISAAYASKTAPKILLLSGGA